MYLFLKVLHCVKVCYFGCISFHKGARKTRLAGNLLDSIFESLVTQIHPATSYPIQPAFRIKKKWSDETQSHIVTFLDFKVTESYSRFMTLDLFRDWKENVCRVADVASFDFANPLYLPPAPYELPDGNTILLAADRFSLPELLFNANHFDYSSTVYFLEASILT